MTNRPATAKKTPSARSEPVEGRVDSHRTVREPLPVLDPVVCCPDLLGGPLSDEDAEAAARLFKALADPTRVKLLSMIAAAGQDGEACVCDLVDGLEVGQPTVSHHLKVLLDAGLVDRERRASWAYYRLRPGALAAAAKALGGVC